MRPRVGAPIPTGSGTCSYSHALGEPLCPLPATHHFLVADTGEGRTGRLTACPTHRSVATGLSDDWHPFGSVCDIPETTWIAGKPGAGDGRCVWDALEQIIAEHTTEPTS